MGNLAHPNAAAGAGEILDDNGLTELLPHLVRDQARDQIGRATSNVGHNHGDGSRGIILRQRRERLGEQPDHNQSHQQNV